MAFQKGHKFSAKAMLFDGALKRAIAQDDGKRLREAAEQLLTLAAEGEQWAIKELADRLDGKAAQAIEVNDNRDVTELSTREIFALVAAQRAAQTGDSAGDASSVH